MKATKVRLLVALVLLLGWLSWLAYLAATKTNPVVVSHSQVMASTHFLLVEVKADPETGVLDKKVNIVEDLRPVGGPLEGKIVVENIREATIAGEKEGSRFQGEGPYLLTLIRKSDGSFYLPPVGLRPDGSKQPQWAYRWNAPGVQKQFNSLVPKQ
jgi:hypothetical protein